MTANIPPCPSGTARCIAEPRRRTRRAAEAAVSAPVATSALYSPSECPAAQAGAGKWGYASRSAATTAQLVTKIAG